MILIAQAFLFDANTEGIPSFYGGYFDPAFLKALGAADPLGITTSRILRGDVPVSWLCQKVTAVSGDFKSQNWTIGHDMEVYRTVIWDQADALANQWNSLDLESFPMTLARHRIHCIALPTLAIDLREQVDRALRQTSGYLGSLTIDMGNPLQRRLFIEWLVDDAVILNGAVTLELSWEGAPDSFFSGAAEFVPNGEKRVSYGELDALKPLLPNTETLSERGRISVERYEGKRSFTVEDRVIHALSRFQDRDQSSYSFKSSSHPLGVIEAELSEAKFSRYLLNPEHVNGSGKAKFFRDVLAIGPDDWRYLAAQFYEGFKHADLAGLKIKEWNDGFGASFNCIFPITGLNGRIAMVETNWIMEPGNLPRLSTAYPAPMSEGAVAVQQSNVVASDIGGDKRWEAIYKLADNAGSLAAEQCVPTPMKVAGFAVEMEGLCGSASICIPDARRGFARWVIRSNKGNRHYKSGAVIYAMLPSQSIDRALAYAKAFATILKLNGVECSVESHLD